MTHTHPHSTIAVIQARMTSERLPGKVLHQLGGRPVLAWVVRAAQESGVFDHVVVATSTDSTDDVVADVAAPMGVQVVRGSLGDVLSRFAIALDTLNPDVVVRLTADCPLLDPAIIRLAVSAFDPDELDYLSTTLVRTLPRGLDVEVCSAEALRRAVDHATGVDRVHVTSYLYRQPGRFRVAGLTFEPRGDHYRATLDTVEDARMLEATVAALGDAPPAFATLVEYLDDNPEIASLNQSVQQKPIEAG